MKHSILAFLKSMTCVVLFFVLCVLTWDRLLEPVIKPVSKLATTWTCDVVVDEGPGDNRHVLITEIRDDVLPYAGFVSLPEQGVTYLPLIPSSVPGKPLVTDYRVFVQIPKAIDEITAQKVLSAGELSGFLRRPRYDFFNKLNEDAILGEWCDGQTAECWILDPNIPEPMKWTDLKFLGISALLFAVAFYGVLTFLTSLIGTKFHAALMLVTFAVICGQGFLIEHLDTAGSAYWNTLSPALMLTCMVIGGLGAVLTLLRFATIAALESKTQEDVAVVPTLTGTEPFQVTKLGFIVRDQQGERDYLDVDVVSFQILKQEQKGKQIRTFRLKVKSGNELEVFAVSDALKIDQEDPFNEFFARLLSTMVRVYRTKFQAGEELTGEGWAFSLGGFTIGTGSKIKNFSHHTITSAEWIDEEFCVWTAEQEEAILRIPSHGENAQVFSFLMQEFMPKKALPTSNYKHQLGRLLEKSPFSIEVADLSMICFAVAIMGGIVGLSGIIPGIIPYAIAGGGILFGLMMKSRRRAATLSVFEQGIVLNTGREQKISYKEIQSYVVRNHANKTEFAIETVELDKPLEFVLHSSKPQARSAAVQLEEQLISVVSDRLLKLLIDTGSAPWTGPISFTLEGLKISEKGKTKLIPFTDVERVDVGHDKLTIVCGEKSSINLIRTATNVLPGYKTFQKVLTAVQPQPVEAASV